MKNISFLSDNFPFLEVKFSMYLNRRVFVMTYQFIKPFLDKKKNMFEEYGAFKALNHRSQLQQRTLCCSL